MPQELLIRLTRTSPTHHRLAYTRPDGFSEDIELETKSCLFHDLLHFAVETEAGLHRSFYGLLATSKSYASLGEDADPTDRSEIAATERLVGGLTSVVKQGAPVEPFISVMTNIFDAHEERLPEWVTPEVIARIQERMRRLNGEWNATPFGQTMTLRFPLA